MSIEEIKRALYEHYEIDEKYADDEKGCFINGEWLSIREILEILEKLV